MCTFCVKHKIMVCLGVGLRPGGWLAGKILKEKNAVAYNNRSRWNSDHNEIHPLNLEIKTLMREGGLTQKEVSQITRIPRRRLSKALNSWYPMSDWLIEQILAIISERINS